MTRPAALAARHLGRLAGGPPAVCPVFCSRAGDASLGVHQDTRYGTIVQVDDAKDWQIGAGRAGRAAPLARQVTTGAGDIRPPENLPHAVTTPARPGHPVHLAFALDRDAMPGNRAHPGQPAHPGRHAWRGDRGQAR